MTRPSVDASVVICAYTMDRWGDLGAALESIRRQSVAPRDIVLVVDHNPDLLALAKREFPDVRVVPNRGKGHSAGRNTGIAESQGSLVVYLDDDAVAHVDWLKELVACCAAPDVLGAVGRIEARWTGTKPEWFPDEYLWVVGCSYRGLPPAGSEVRNLLGAGMAIKRSVLQRAGGFSSLVGRHGGSFPLSCDETEFCIRAKSVLPQGRFMQQPTAVISHRASAARATWRYFALRCYAEGIGKAYVASIASAPDTLATERSYVLKTLSKGALRGLADGIVRFDLSGFARTSAIALGLGCAAAGYVVGKLWTPVVKQRHQVGTALPDGGVP